MNINSHSLSLPLLILSACVFLYAPRANAAGGMKDLSADLTFHDVLMVTFQSHAEDIQSLDSSILDKFAKLDLDQPSEQAKLGGLAARLNVTAKTEGIEPGEFNIQNKQHADLLVASALQHQERVNRNASGILAVLRDESIPKESLTALIQPITFTLTADSVGLFQHYEQALKKHLPELLRMRNEALAEAQQLSN